MFYLPDVVLLLFHLPQVLSNASIIYLAGLAFIRYLSAFSSRIDGANGIQKSLCFIAKFNLDIILKSLGFATILLFPRALGPNSSLPQKIPIILPFEISSAISPATSSSLFAL